MSIIEYTTTTKEWDYTDTEIVPLMPRTTGGWSLVHTSTCSIASKHGSRGRLFWTWTRTLDVSFCVNQMTAWQASQLIADELVHRGYSSCWKATPGRRAPDIEDVLHDPRRTIAECVDHLIRIVPVDSWDRRPDQG
jgi:hypothetical protein